MTAPGTLASPRRDVLASWLRVAGIGLALVAAVWTTSTATNRRIFTIDSVILLAGQEATTRCLSDGVLTGCYEYMRDYCCLSKFPLLQTIPAWSWWIITRDQPTGQSMLAWLNTVVVVGAVVGFILWAKRRFGVAMATLAGLLAVCGMLIPYALSSFGEPLALVAIGTLCVVLLGRSHRSSWVIVLAAAAVLSKETFFPFVLLFGMGSLLLAPCRPSVRRARASHLLLGAGLGLLLQFTYNVFRYTSLLNRGYATEPYARPGLVPANVADQVVSPNAGFVWFWPGVAIALAVLVAAVVRAPASADERLARRGAAMILAGFVLALVLNGMWWAPFGWYAWGSRLLVPSCAPVIIGAVAVLGRRPAAERRHWFRGWRAIVVGLVCTAALLPSIGVVWTPDEWISQIEAEIRENPDCDWNIPITDPRTQDCQQAEAWRTTDMPLLSVVPGWSGQPSYWVVVWLAAAGMWLLIGADWWEATAAARDEGRARRPHRERPASTGTVPVRTEAPARSAAPAAT